MAEARQFEAVWRAAVRFRHASRELEPLLRDVFEDVLRGTSPAVVASLEKLLLFLTSPAGRTDANCSTTHNFITEIEGEWSALPAELRAILDDMSGTLHDSVYAPEIARTFEATPEQLLERIRRIV